MSELLCVAPEDASAMWPHVERLVAPILTNQYNQNVSNQQNAANNLYGAGNTTANTLTNLNQTGVNNQINGINAANSALSANQWGPQQTLAAQGLLQSIPTQ